MLDYFMVRDSCPVIILDFNGTEKVKFNKVIVIR